jgi:NAD-dependent deacetylase
MSEELNMEFVEMLTQSQQIVVFTGAGISTNSGIPDFRGPEGVWKSRAPIYFHDFLESAEARMQYWTQKSEDWDVFGSAEPNAVHKAIADLEKADKLCMVLTQNIDGLHAAAGTSAGKLVELHGTNSEVECLTCGNREPADPFYKAFPETQAVPLCDCGGFYKPATISFGQNLREADMQRAQECLNSVDLMIALGSTLSVQPASSYTLFAARNGRPYVVINRGMTEHDGHPCVTLRLEGDVSEIFPPAVEAALAMQG